MARRIKATDVPNNQPTGGEDTMKVNRHDLQIVLNELDKVAQSGKKNQEPIWSFVHMSMVDGGNLRLVANDLEVAVIAKLDATVPGLKQDAVLPAKMFSKLIKGAKKGSKEVVEIEVLKDPHTAGPTYRVGKDAVKITVEGMDTKIVPDNTPDNFPDPDASVGEKVDNVVVVDNDLLRRSLEFVSLAASNDTTRYNLNCVVLHFEDLKVITTDGHRLHMGKLPVQEMMFKPNMCKVPVPKLFADMVARVLKQADKDDPALFSLHKNGTDKLVLRFEVNGRIKWTVVCLVSDVSFPNYKHVVPAKKDTYNVFEIKRDILEKVCKRMIIVRGDEGQPGGIFVLGQDKLDVVVKRPDNEASTSVEVVTKSMHEGETETDGSESETKVYNHTVSANMKYILDAVAEKVSDVVRVSFSDNLSPLLFDNGDGFEAAVMPMRM